MLGKDGEQDSSLLHKRYKNSVEKYKNIENEFYSNDSPNDALRRCWKTCDVLSH